MFNKEFYESKLKKLQEKNQKILNDYIGYGINFGREIAEIGQEAEEIQKMIKENTPAPEVKPEVTQPKKK